MRDRGYVVRGEGSIVADRPYALRARNVALISADTPVALSANPGTTLLVLAFRPDAEWGPTGASAGARPALAVVDAAVGPAGPYGGGVGAM